MDQLRDILFKDIQTVRISDTFEKPEMATDLFEHTGEVLADASDRGKIWRRSMLRNGSS
jgi:uncharacterized protein